MQNQNPIGFFDSGIGGTSIWKEVHQILPHENTIFLADSKNAPYGEKSKDEIIYLSQKNTEFLLNKNCKLIVVACNTATTNAIKVLRATYNVPFIGIEPAIKPAALQSNTKTIGILATKGTLSSELFNKSMANFKDTIFVEQIGLGLVDLIEQGKLNSPETHQLLEQFLTPMIGKSIDYLVLGCTHYPYLIPQIKKILPKHIKIIDSGIAVARQTKNILEQNNISNAHNTNSNYTFYTNGNPTILKQFIPKMATVISENF